MIQKIQFSWKVGITLRNRIIQGVAAAAVLVSSMFLSLPSVSAEDKLQWIEGGQKVDVGKDLAELQLGADFIFLDGENTIKYVTESGMKPTNTEVGLVLPKDQNQMWALYFEYWKPGHIKDDEKADIDAKKLLQSYKDGTEEVNKELKPEDRLTVDKWDIEPFYDNSVHSLSWSLLLRDVQNNPIINYNIRLLTREGYVSAILVSDPTHLASDRKLITEQILPQFEIKQGQRYEDFNESTDKLANYGLTGLILGGAGLAVAKKAGLLALLLPFIKKFGVLIVIAGGAIWGFIRNRFGRNKRAAQTEQPAEQASIDQQQ